jgi:dTDP-4-amino-4,6-dideoxygalactose transaminase
MIPYENLQKSNATFVNAYRNSFDDVLKSGWYILGNEVKNFETAFASYNQVKYCIGVANGLDALSLALHACNLQKGSEVIVPSNTYIATILAILHNGLKPVLVEPDLNTYNINAQHIESVITSNTKAIMPVHLYGKMCDMNAIMQIADKHQLIVIEDAAQAHGASLHNIKAGAFGHMTGFSFYPTKNLGALADGGAITTNSQIYNQSLRKLRNYGSDVKYYNETVGFNSRLDEMQAAFLSVKLKALDAINQHKKDLAQLYFNHLKSDFILPAIQQGYNDVFHIYCIRHQHRDKLRSYLLKNNIGTEIHYPVPPSKQKAMMGIIDNVETPIADLIHATTLSLPISYGHTKDDIYNVIEVLNAF